VIRPLITPRFKTVLSFFVCAGIFVVDATSASLKYATVNESFPTAGYLRRDRTGRQQAECLRCSMPRDRNIPGWLRARNLLGFRPNIDNKLIC